MTDRLFNPDPDPFDLLGGVPRDLIDTERATLPEGASYLRVEADVLDDGAVVDVLAECGSDGVAGWFAIMVAAKKARDFGMVDVHAHAWGATFGATPQVAMKVIDAMERAGLVWVKRDSAHRWRVVVRIRNWWTWQTITDAERKRLERRRDALASGISGQRPQKPDGGAVTPPASTHRNGNGHQPNVVVEPLARASAPVREAGAQPASDFTPVAAPVEAVQTPADEPRWWQLAADQLAFIHQGDDAVRADLAQRISDHRFSPRRRHDERWTPEAYHRAAADLQRRFDGGWRPQDGSAASAIGFYFSTIGSHRVELPDLPPPTNTETHTDDKPTPARARHAGLAAFD